MSVQFGVWNFDGTPVDRDLVAKAGRLLAPYADDSEEIYVQNGTALLYRAFHTTAESRLEGQPVVSKQGTVITWDGRLDNREELLRPLRWEDLREPSDAAIVLGMYDRHGRASFQTLLGDWALGIWSEKEKTLCLAKDFVGTRPLFYSWDDRRVIWSTVLDPLVLLAGRPLALNREWVAGYLSGLPATHQTPYAAIHAVAPGTSVHFHNHQRTEHVHWSFDSTKQIRHRTDSEYEEHFRQVFRESVRRRLRSDSPVLAELSGGMDSSSIVCMADEIIEKGQANTALETISYYDDREPNWNERPYFSKVEEWRGKPGCHVDVGEPGSLVSESDDGSFPAIPSCALGVTQAAKAFAACFASHGHRVLLSGIGGDEVLGGVPTAAPELADLLAAFRFGAFAGQLKAWALAKRKPLLHLLGEVICGFLPETFVGTSQTKAPLPWLTPEFARSYGAAWTDYPARNKLLGPRPSFQENLRTLEALRRQLACSGLPRNPRHELRYPYLDRDLLEFLYAIPRDQLVRPGARRSLMRRALADIVPREILERRRKANVVRAPIASASEAWVRLLEMNPQTEIASLGIVDHKAFSEALRRAKGGHEVAVVPVLRTLAIEAWLRHLKRWRVADGGPAVNCQELLYSREASFCGNGRRVLAQRRRVARPTRDLEEFSAEKQASRKGGDLHEIRKA